MSSSCCCPGHCYCYSSGQLAAHVTHGCFNKDEFLAKGHHSFSFSAMHEAACIAWRFVSWKACSNPSCAGKRYSLGSWWSPSPAAPKREKMVLILWRKRSHSSASSYPWPAAGRARMYLVRSNASRGRKKNKLEDRRKQ